MQLILKFVSYIKTIHLKEFHSREFLCDFTLHKSDTASKFVYTLHHFMQINTGKCVAKILSIYFIPVTI